jgi:chromosomal replication initiation ATPase DnaA
MSVEKERIIIDPYVYPGIRPVDLPENFLKNIKISTLKYDVSHVIKGIERYKKISEANLKSRCRKREFCDARHMYCNMLREKMDYSLINIGRTLGRDHTTVIHSVNNHRGLYETDPKYKAIYDKIDRYVDIMSASDNNNDD